MRKLAAFLLIFLLLTSNLAASPESRVKEMIRKLNSSGSYSALLDYIHWPSSFSELPAAERKKMGVRRPEDLKQRVKSLMENPEKVFQEQWQARVKSMSPEQKQVMEGVYKQQLGKMSATLTEMKEKVRRTRYKVLDSSTKGDSAVVTVEGVVDGRTKLREIDLKKIQGQWYLPSMNFGKGQMSPGMFGG